MTANRNLLRMKFAKVIQAYAARTGCSLDYALDVFYKSQIYELMRDGVSDMHCMSEAYLVDELSEEFSIHKPEMKERRASERDPEA